MNEKRLEEIIANRTNIARVLDHIKEGIIAHDLDRNIFFFNKEAEKITGYNRKDVLGTDCHSIFDGPLCGGHCSFCDSQLPTLQDHIAYPVTIITKSGETRSIEMSVTRMNDEKGEFIGVLASMKDITDILDLKFKAGKIASFSNIIGQNKNMLQVFQQIRDVAVYPYPVNIFGETGTGKELVAAAIHNESRRSGGPFVPINCGALPEGLIESELFGHVKGAFSGALYHKKGRFELADGGTIFLDEVAELSKPMQVRLLRLLQEGTFEKVGGESTIKVDVRVISASNKELKKEVQKDKFRDDLYYRLNVVPIQLPPLRERRNDIPLLVEHFIEQAKTENHLKRMRIAKDALLMLMDYTWPGNVRELQNAIQFSIVKSRDGVILPEDLPIELRDMKMMQTKRGPNRKLDVELVSNALVKSGGNKAKAAKILGVGRATLYRFLTENPKIEEQADI